MLDVATKKLFEAIENENLEDFKQILTKGADVNAFDENGNTPLMCLISVLLANDNNRAYKAIKAMLKLLLYHQNININIQNREHIYVQRQKTDQHGRLIYLLHGQEVAEVGMGHYIRCSDQQHVNNIDENGERTYLCAPYDSVMESVKTSDTQKNTALHLACKFGIQDIVKILLTHPDIKTDVRNHEDNTPENCIVRGSEVVIKKEIQKAQEGKQLLTALSNGNINRAKVLLNQELNPNCWKRNVSGEIETPLSLIIKSCLQRSTEDKKTVLTKLLKHKDLDFSQMKSIQAIEQNPQLKQTIEQAIKERLTNAINSKDLDNVKKTVEDNCLMNHTIVIATLMDVDNPTQPIKDYLNTRSATNNLAQPVANVHNIPAEFEQAFQEVVSESENIKEELSRTKVQLAQKEKDLIQTQQQLRREQEKYPGQQTRVYGPTNQVDQLRKHNKDLRDKNNNSRKQSNYAATSFVLSGIFAIGVCLTISDPLIWTSLAGAALILLATGCYYSYKVNTTLSDIESVQVTENILGF